MEENELDFNGLEDLMPKIEEAIKDSKHREKEIELNETFLKEETRLGYYEEGKAKIEEMKAQKEEMDEMTKPHLNRAKLAIDRLKEEERVDFNNKMIQIAKKRQTAKKRYESLMSRANSQEDKDRIEAAYNRGLDRIAREEGTYKTFHEDTMNKLNKWDEFIIDSLHEFGMPIPTASKSNKRTKQTQQGETTQETETAKKEQTEQESEEKKEQEEEQTGQEEMKAEDVKQEEEQEEKRGEDEEGFQPPAVVEKGKEEIQPVGEEQEQGDQSNLPIRSGLEIYDDIYTEHIGKWQRKIYQIANANLFSFKGKDTLNAILDVPLGIIKLPITLAAKVPNAFMRTNKKMDTLRENVGNLSPEEFNTLVEWMDPSNSNMLKYKINTSCLDVIGEKLGADYIEETEEWRKTRKGQLVSRIDELSELYKKGELTQEQEQEYINLNKEYESEEQKINSKGTKVEQFKDATKKKSSDHTNIEGWLAARPDPDNREQIHHLAELEEKKGEAESEVEKTRIDREQAEYIKENTKIYVGRLNKNNRINSGMLYSGEVEAMKGRIQILKDVPQTLGRKILAVGAASVSIANFVKQINVAKANETAVNEYNQNTVDPHNEQIENLSSQADEQARNIAENQVVNDSALREAGDMRGAGGSVSNDTYHTLHEGAHEQFAENAENVQQASSGTEALEQQINQSTTSTYKSYQDNTEAYSGVSSYDMSGVTNSKYVDNLTKTNEFLKDVKNMETVERMGPLQKFIDSSGLVNAGFIALLVSKFKNRNKRKFKEEIKVKEEEKKKENIENKKEQEEQEQVSIDESEEER